MKIMLAQINPRVGDIDYNLEKHLAFIKKAQQQNADLIVFPELSLIGYPAEDLLLRPAFLAEVEHALAKLTAAVDDLYCLVGHPCKTNRGLENTCSLLHKQQMIAQYAKQHLPNYGMFDERRYFVSNTQACVVDIRGILTGLVICEDLWEPSSVKQAVAQGAKLILSPNASPFESDKLERRHAIVSKRTREHQIPIVYVNLIGGQDEFVFDGGSFATHSTGEVCLSAPFFKEALMSTSFADDMQKQAFTVPGRLERIYQTLVLSVQDYVAKNGFKKVVLVLSGGIDSALVLTIAVDALGADAVTAVALPSRYTAKISLDDAAQIAANLKVELQSYSIEPTFSALLNTLQPAFINYKPDITEENMQARIRAVILMALSNKFGHLVLTTGNRSELAVGYCTLYGDMVGGFAVIKDIPKTLVYELAQYRNQLSAVIPKRILHRAPTAELAENQTDQDSLPPYAELDAILDLYLNRNASQADIISAGFKAATVDKIITLIKRNEYKRRQGAPGPHINHKSFNRDWRYPISNGFKG